MSKSRGIYVPRGTRIRWAADNAGKHFCECGCGEVVAVTTDHYPDAPRYRHGHNSRVANHRLADGRTRVEWSADQQGRHVCACGCRTTIPIRPEHHSEGVPTYVNGHYARGRNQTDAEAWASTRRRLLAYTVSTPDDGCWQWSGAHHIHTGRAQLTTYFDGKPRNQNAARYSYESFRGSIPAGLQIDHTCRNVNCVNPWHLDAVALKENNRRRRLSNEEHRALAPQRPTDWTP